MLDIPDSHQDLLDSPVATLATIGPDGRPQLSEIWFLADADGVRISLNSSRQKTKNLARNPACTLFILDTARPSRYLEIRADAQIAADSSYEFADKVGVKYGADLRVHDHEGETRVVVSLNPVKINAIDMAAS
jgi:PPOX class probable F420-dependent enzyme